jgi:hypothetical protein
MHAAIEYQRDDKENGSANLGPVATSWLGGEIGTHQPTSYPVMLKVGSGFGPPTSMNNHFFNLFSTLQAVGLRSRGE